MNVVKSTIGHDQHQIALLGMLRRRQQRIEEIVGGRRCLEQCGLAIGFGDDRAIGDVVVY